MHLIQIFLPLRDNGGKPLPITLHAGVRAELVEKFGGLTAFTRAPAEGLWQEGEASPVRDDIVIFEVMAETLDRKWWRAYRGRLEAAFRQEQVIVRAQATELL